MSNLGLAKVIGNGDLNVLALSDLHLHRYKLNLTAKHLQRFCDSVLHLGTYPIDVIVIAGNLGYYNHDNQKFLRYLVDTYNVIVLFTYGNYDLHLSSPKQVAKYKGQSFNRVMEMKKWANTQNHIYFLDGDYIDIKGVRFGGLCNWYDGSYKGIPQLINTYWCETSKDHRYILKNGEPYSHFLHIRDEVNAEENLSNLLQAKCDYVFTAISPVLDKSLIDPRWEDSYTTGFYYSKDLENIGTYEFRYLQFGHTYFNVVKNMQGVLVFNASLGNPLYNKDYTPLIVQVSTN